jgi:hypothetical protein
MPLMRIVLGLLLLAGCAGARAGNADVRRELPRTHEQLGGLMVLFAATVVEGGGVGGNNRNPPRVVLEVAEEFPKQHLAPGRVKPGRQAATFRIIASSKFEEERDFETPLNGTHIIAFGNAGDGPLVVYANHVFADTQENRANAMAGRGPAASAPLQGPLFFASLGIAFAAIFLAWFRVAFGAIALAASVALWLGYEAMLPKSVDIRVDLLVLFPMMLAAAVSLAFAARDAARGKGRQAPPDSKE